MEIKDVTRRDWEKPRCKIGATHLLKTAMLKPLYFAKAEIKEVYQERLRDISLKQVKREGYSSPEDYFNAYYRINKIPQKDRLLSYNKYLWVVEFEVFYEYIENFQNDNQIEDYISFRREIDFSGVFSFRRYSTQTNSSIHQIGEILSE